ncbi:MAG: histidine phosphatase family protein [Proteobacteria bacterium]|nr:histidine phosphatase family protein [Pseudomonadota bacterium]MBU1714381.1 histidine phosphatase family protein [Pseudomonadota bacterium]
MTTTICLIRHGITEANKTNRFAGRSNEPLHQEGRRQIEMIGQILKPEKICRIFSGPLPRTAESAEILHKIIAAPVTIKASFNEILIPHWDGLTKDEIRLRFGAEYPTWLAQPAEFQVKDCETIEEVQARAVKETEQIFTKFEDKKVVIISHLIVLRCLALHYLNLSINNFRAIKIDNGSISRLVRTKKDGNTSTIFWKD